MTDTISKTHSSDTSASLPDRHRSNSYDYQPKRVRKGSISGRLRTASDLEELGYIDKAQKGLIKDLIISGDTKLQALLDKYEQGDGRELLALIKEGYLSMRKPSIELIEGLDFDFINALRDDDDLHHDGGFFADLDADFPSLPSSVKKEPASSTINTNNSTNTTTNNNSIHVKKERRASTDDVAELLLHHNRSRRATLDALLLHDLIFDDHHNNSHNTGNANANNNNNNNLQSGLLGHGLPDDLLLHDDYLDPSDNVFNDLYQQFSNEQQHHQQNNNNAFNNNDTLNHNSNIDLSAYAQHAATLQQGKHVLPNNKKLNPNNNSNSNKPGTLASQTLSSNAGLVKKTGVQPTFAPNTNTFLYNPGHNNATNTGYGYNNATLSNLQNTNNKNNTNMSILHNTNNTMMGYHPNMLNNGNNNMNAAGNNNGLPMSVSASALTAAAQRPAGFIGAYSPEQRRQRIEKFLEKRARRVWSRKVKYDVRKNFADSRLRIKGRFVKKEDEDMMRELMNI